jgi:hypothetical protein
MCAARQSCKRRVYHGSRPSVQDDAVLARDDAVVDLKSPTRRADVMVGLAVIAASIVVAIVIHRPVVYCSYIGPVPPRGCITTDYPMTLRLGIVAAGLSIAGLIIAIRRYQHRHRG